MFIRMNRFLNVKSIAFALIALALVAGAVSTIALRGGTSSTHAAGSNLPNTVAAQSSKLAFCAKLGKTYQASSGAMMACNGPQPNGNGAAAGGNKKKPSNFGSNVDAANPQEDISPNGTLAYGQSEESTAATGRYVVEAWNDSTGFFSPPCSPMYKDQLTGFGFSSNSGKSFTDLGGLPNSMCMTSVYEGDPSVETWQVSGTAYFYISSLFLDSTTPAGKVAMDVCQTSGSNLICNPTPVIIGNPGPGGFLDKDFLSIDPVRGLLYATYSDFTTGDNIDLAVCDIGNGALGGTPATPVCVADDAGPAAVVVASSTDCNELEGAYPAVDLATGDVYVAYENNWASNLYGCNLPVQENVNMVPFGCIISAATSFPGPGVCAYATNLFPLAFVPIVSMDSACIPGYNRTLCTGNPAPNDFPRIAVSDQFGTVSIVWNDARLHPYGDILLQSFGLGDPGTGGLFPNAVQSSPVRVNSSTSGWHMMPALRNVDDDGDLNISFYQRPSGNTDLTDVYAAIDVSPVASKTVTSNVKITTGPSAWVDTSSDIVPNFGDYTDNYVQAVPCHGSSSKPICTTQTLYVAWADGRLGDPQPFSAHAHTN
jgi:hypothetical protein